VIVLAAGDGTRMKSSQAKVLHSVAGRSLLGHVLAAVDHLEPTHIRVVVGANRISVETHVAQISPNATIVFQEKRGGTGHATQLALAGTSAAGTTLVLAGDTPMLTGQSLAAFLDAHEAGNFAASVLTAEHPEPTGYGRIIRDDSDQLLRIVEERDATEDEKYIVEINSGVYAFDSAKLANTIGEITDSNSHRESST
jgi:bifunctional UDP-N-acetylglucosamine pyrophosphorylase/glucosamine-1-phosphate N-acetyltransferase